MYVIDTSASYNGYWFWKEQCLIKQSFFDTPNQEMISRFKFNVYIGCISYKKLITTITTNCFLSQLSNIPQVLRATNAAYKYKFTLITCLNY